METPETRRARLLNEQSSLRRRLAEIQLELGVPPPEQTQDHAAAMLRRVNAELTDLYNRAPCGYHSIGSDGRFRRINDTELSWLGYTREELVGKKSFSDLLTPESRARLSRRRSALWFLGEVTGLDLVVVRKDGTTMPVSINATTIRDANGTPLEVRVTVIDTTLRRSTEEALRRSRDELSVANAALERANRAKDEFLASMSHELRTPLNAVLGLTEALQEDVYGALQEQQRRAMTHIEVSARHLLSLISDILDLSKIDAGKMTLDFRPVPVDDACRACLRAVQDASQKKRQSVSFRNAGGIKTVVADHRKLKQILTNLLSNAVKFTPEGGALGIDVDVGEAGEEVHFTVWDTGIGVAPEEQPRLFQPFVQLDGSLARLHAGTGLGLVLVRKLVELHGGGVAVESAPNQGSRFSVMFPTLPAATESRRGTSLPPIEVATVPRALVIDGSVPVAERLSRALLELDLLPIFHEGPGAVDRAASERPHVILLVVDRHTSHAWSVLRELKADRRTERIPVIALSAHDSLEQARAVGAAALLAEPVSRKELEATVLSVLGRPESVPPTLPNSSRRHSGVRARPARILLAEDDEANIATVHEALRSGGYGEPAVARNGIEAVNLAKAVKPDLILMDVQMPNMDGIAAIKAIRANHEPRLQAVPIIAMTGLAVAGDRERCLAAGASDYLTKPVGPRRLTTAINALLGEGDERCAYAER